MLEYQKEIDQIWDCLYEDWMSEEDKIEFKKEVYTQGRVNDEVLNNNIKEGVSKGYSVEYQMNLVKILLKRWLEGKQF
jgi:DNA helicase IV